jgi:hypothetical protein
MWMVEGHILVFRWQEISYSARGLNEKYVDVFNSFDFYHAEPGQPNAGVLAIEMQPLPCDGSSVNVHVIICHPSHDPIGSPAIIVIKQPTTFTPWPSSCCPLSWLFLGTPWICSCVACLSMRVSPCPRIAQSMPFVPETRTLLSAGLLDLLS